MKRIKSIVAFCTVMLLGTMGAFADKAQYDKLLQEAKSYEQQQKWVHAMGTYWDAMLADETRLETEAYKSFRKIEDAINKGKPGLGEFDEFSIYDGWVELCKDYEIYWNEHMNEIYTLGFQYRKGNLDMTTRTATYNFGMFVYTTPKFKRISVVERSGPSSTYDYQRTPLKEQYNINDWVDIPKSWPQESVFKDSSVIPTVSYDIEEDPHHMLPHFDIQTIFSDKSYYIKTLKPSTEEKLKFKIVCPAWAVVNRFSVEEGYNNVYKTPQDIIEEKNAFKIQFHLEDNNGRVIVAMEKPCYIPKLLMGYIEGIFIPYGSSPISNYTEAVSLSGISASDVKLLDSGDFRIVVDKLVLEPNSLTIKPAKSNSKKIYDVRVTNDIISFDLTPKNTFKGISGKSQNEFSNSVWNSNEMPVNVMYESAVVKSASKNFKFRKGDYTNEVFYSIYDGFLTKDDVDALYEYERLGTLVNYVDWADNIVRILKKATGFDFKKIDIYFCRLLTEEEKSLIEEQEAIAAREKAEAEAKKHEEDILTAFKNGILHTKKLGIAVTEKKGSFIVKEFDPGSLAKQSGLQEKDIIKKIIVTDSSGNEKTISLPEFSSIPAPASCTFVVQRGSGKKAQEINIEVPVEWNEDELKNLGL